MSDQSRVLTRVISTMLGGFAGAAGAACTVGFELDERGLLVIGGATLVGALLGATGGPSAVRVFLSAVTGQ
jgi:hypothetical protein